MQGSYGCEGYLEDPEVAVRACRAGIGYGWAV